MSPRLCLFRAWFSYRSGSIWSCGIPPSFPTHQFKAVLLLHPCHLDHRSGFLLPRTDRQQTCRVPRRAGMCVAVERSTWRVPLSYENYTVALSVVFRYIPLVLIAILYLTIALKIKSQKIPGEQSVNAREQRLKRERNVLNMSIAIVLAFAVCWLPLSIYWPIILFSSENAMIWSCGFIYFESIAFFLAYSNCPLHMLYFQWKLSSRS